MSFKVSRLFGLASGAVLGLAVYGVCADAAAGEPDATNPGRYDNSNVQQAGMPKAPPPQTAPQPAPGAAYRQPPYPQPPNNVHLAGAAKGASASSTVSAEEIQQLPARVRNLENLFQGMQNEVINAKAEAAAAKRAAAEQQGGPKVSTKGGLKVESEDGQYSFKLFGRLMVDSAWYKDDKSKLGDGTELRRARIGVGGTMLNDWEYKFEVDFAGDDVSIKDAYLAWTGSDPFELMIGNFKEPLSLETLTSSRFITFMERPMAVNAFSPERHIGIMGSYGGDRSSAALGVFGSTVGGDPASEGNERFDIAARVTGAPVLTDMSVVHLGLGGVLSDPSDEGVRFRDRPDSHVTDVRFLDTDNDFMSLNPGWLDNVSRYAVLNPEFAAVYGPASIQGEYFYVPVWQNDCLPEMCPDVTLSGWYAQVSYFLTGEMRNYKAGSGKFDRVKPKHNVTSKSCCGAFEIGARIDNLDLDDGQDFQKGDGTNLTLGLNWYLTSHIRAMFNYVKVWNNASASGNDGNLLSGVTFPGYDDPDIFQVRAQVDW